MSAQRCSRPSTSYPSSSPLPAHLGLLVSPLSARINAGLVAVAFVIALAFIALSAARHSTAMIACEGLFASQTMSNSTIGGQTTSLDTGSVTSGTEICNIWTWVQVGIMGLLFIILGLCEVSLLQGVFPGGLKLILAGVTGLLSYVREHLCIGAEARPVRPSSSACSSSLLTFDPSQRPLR